MPHYNAETFIATIAFIRIIIIIVIIIIIMIMIMIMILPNSIANP